MLRHSFSVSIKNFQLKLEVQSGGYFSKGDQMIQSYENKY